MSKNPRLWEIDALRGSAILLMISFHIAFDLAYFWQYNIHYDTGLFYVEGRLAAILFLGVSGASSALAKPRLKRTASIVFWALMITILTYWLSPENYVRFGILHLIACCLLITPLLDKLSDKQLLLLTLGILVLAPLVKVLPAESGLLLPLGIRTPDFASFDYYPLFPWSSCFIAGHLGIHWFLRRPHGRCQPAPTMLQPLTAIGRYPLTIYLLHQPILLVLLLLLCGIPAQQP